MLEGSEQSCAGWTLKSEIQRVKYKTENQPGATIPAHNKGGVEGGKKGLQGAGW